MSFAAGSDRVTNRWCRSKGYAWAERPCTSRPPKPNAVWDSNRPRFARRFRDRSIGIATMAMPSSTGAPALKADEGIGAADVMVVAPTRLEYVACRLALGHGSVVVRGGMGGQRPANAGQRATVVCGVAGGLDPTLQPGDVVIATEVGTERGEIIPCDSRLIDAMKRGAT